MKSIKIPGLVIAVACSQGSFCRRHYTDEFRDWI